MLRLTSKPKAKVRDSADRRCEGDSYEQGQRDLLEVLQSELDFMSMAATAVRCVYPGELIRVSGFADLPQLCIYGKAHPCSECQLIDFVPGDKRSEQVPCHSVPLDESEEDNRPHGSETVSDLNEC